MSTAVPTLTIRNVDHEIHEHLRKQAAIHGRSMEAEVRDILITDMKRKHTKPGTIARRIHKRFTAIGGGEDLPLPERELVGDPVTFEE